MKFRRAGFRAYGSVSPVTAVSSRVGSRGERERGAIDGGGSTGTCQCKLVGLHGNQPTSSSRRPCSSHSTYRGRRKREGEADRAGGAEGGGGAVDQEVRKTETREEEDGIREGRKSLADNEGDAATDSERYKKGKERRARKHLRQKKKNDIGRKRKVTETDENDFCEGMVHEGWLCQNVSRMHFETGNRSSSLGRSRRRINLH